MKRKMKTKVWAMTMMLAMIVSVLTAAPVKNVQAAGNETVIIDGSVLLKDANESVGEMMMQTRGQYLQSGSSRIGLIGTGKIRVSATTIAQQVVSSVKVAVRVERLVNGSWVSCTGWTASKNNTYTLTSAKDLTVPRGYYYRVWSTHNAASDSGYSNTNALYVD